MIFLIGTQKSGTTWLRDCFAHVCSVPKREWYFVALYEKVSTHVAEFGHLTEAERQTAVRSVMAAAWRSLLESTAPGAIFDKSAYPCTSTFMPVRNDIYSSAVALARDTFPKARIIVIVRDPRAVLNSTVHYLNHFRAGWGEMIDPTEFATNWKIQNTQWLRDEPSMVVRYEDLKADFVGTLSRIFAACELPISAPALEEIRRCEWNIDKTRTRQPEIYRTGLVDEYKQRLSLDTISKVESAAAELMARLMYTAINTEVP